MRLAEGDPTDFLVILRLNRPRITVFLIFITFASVFFTFNVLYDGTVCTIERNSIGTDEGQEENSLDFSLIGDGGGRSDGAFKGTGNDLNGDLNLLIGGNGLVYGNHVHFRRTSRRLPQALIIGVRKCGTRALLEMLFLHPNVQKAAGEVHFFDRDENYKKGLEWYRKKMPHSFRNQITIEKSPSYFITPEVPERVRAMNSSVKILIIVREPVTRAISDYAQLKSHSATASSAIASQSMHQKSFEELALRPDGSVNLSYRPVATSVYHRFLHRWLDVFTRNQIWIVNGDKLITDPVPELRKVEYFLGLEPKISRNNFFFNYTKGFYCLRNETTDKCLKETKGRKHPKVDAVVITKLRQFFSEHNQKFYDLVGEDFGWPSQ